MKIIKILTMLFLLSMAGFASAECVQTSLGNACRLVQEREIYVISQEQRRPGINPWIRVYAPNVNRQFIEIARRQGAASCYNGSWPAFKYKILAPGNDAVLTSNIMWLARYADFNKVWYGWLHPIPSTGGLSSC